MADEATRSLCEHEASGFMTSAPAETFFVTYPCQGDKTMNISIFHRTLPHLQSAEGWSAPATVEDVKEVLIDFHPTWQAIAL